VGETLSGTDGVGRSEGSSLGASLGPAAGGSTTTPSPQVRSALVGAAMEPATVTVPVDTVTAPGSTAYQALPEFRTSPAGRSRVSDSGRNAPLVLVVSASSRPVSMARVPCGSRCRPTSVQSRPTFVRESAQSTVAEPPEKVSRPVDPAGTWIQEPSPT
jgi:hypothetical protein